MLSRSLLKTVSKIATSLIGCKFNNNFDGLGTITNFGTTFEQTIKNEGSASLKAGAGTYLLANDTVRDYLNTSWELQFDVYLPSGSTSYQVLLGQYTGAVTGVWALYVYPAGNLAIGVVGVNETQSPAGVLTRDTWHTIKLVKTYGSISILVDGISRIDTNNITYLSSSPSLPLCFGSNNAGSSPLYQYYDNFSTTIPAPLQN